MTHRSRPAVAAIAGALTAVLLAGCADDTYVGSGTWEQKPSQQAPQGPNPQDPGQPSSPADPSQPKETDDGVRATGLDQPAAIAALPDGTALVGERTSGRVTKVFPTKDTPQQALYTIGGIDASNGGGLVAMVASPYYSENGLVFAYITTPTEGQIITLNASGVPKTILSGLPKGPAALAIGPDGSVLVATGGSGSALAGQILSIDPWGGPGPSAKTGVVVAPGVPNPAGLCSDGVNVYMVDGGSGPAGSLTGNAVYKVSGEPTDSGGLGSAKSAIITYAAGKDAGAAGCLATPVNIVTAGTDSQSLATTVLSQSGAPAGDPTLSLTGKFGRLRAIALDPIGGGFWVGTYNRDGIGSPVAEDDRVLYVPQSGGSSEGNVS